jgi:endonuclease YncB( thermonuclease family)
MIRPAPDRLFHAALVLVVVAMLLGMGQPAPMPVGAPAPPPAPPAPGVHAWPLPDKGTFTVYVGRVVDGDTVEAYVLTGPVKLRMANINAPELKTAAGPASRDALKGQVEGKLLAADFHGLERYGRTLARLWLPGPPPVDVSQWMIDNKWALPYSGEGPKP